MRLAREGRESAWWQAYDLDDFATYVGLETAAAAIKDYQSTVVPGLMHTPEYARAMYEADVRRHSAERIEELIDVRLTRQRILTGDHPIPFEAVLDEAVFHRMVGGAAVMMTQIDHVIELARLPHVRVQVIPFNIGAHPAMESTFNILEFSGEMPSVVYVEGLAGRVYFDRPQDIARYRQVFDRLCAISLNPQESTDLMLQIRTGFEAFELERRRD